MELRPSLKLVKLSYVFFLLVIIGLAFTEFPPLVLALPVIFLLFTGIRHIKKRFEKIVVSGEHLRYECGLVSKTIRTVELIKVQDIRVDQTLGQRMLGVGDLSLETAGGTSRIELKGIDAPQAASDQILNMARSCRQSG